MDINKMTIKDVQSIAFAINEDEKRILLSNLDIDDANGKDFDTLFETVFLLLMKTELEKRHRIIAYGAGRCGRKNIPIFNLLVPINEIWDNNAVIRDISGIRVNSPDEIAEDVAIIVFLDDIEIRSEVERQLKNKGIDKVYHYKDILDDGVDIEKVLKQKFLITQEMIDSFEKKINEYEIIKNDFPSVLFSVVNKKLKEYKMPKLGNITDINNNLFSNIYELLKINNDEIKINNLIDAFFSNCIDNLFDFIVRLEKLMERLLYGSVKTKKRPIRMKGDYPYDSIAVVETFIVLLNDIFEQDVNCILLILDEIKKYTGESISLLAAEIYFLVERGEFQHGLEIARQLLHKGSDDFVANEAFYYVAKKCKENNIYVDEPICEFDLNEFFCWCGINYVWCGGYDYEREDAAFSPCFRPSCIAAPRGDFFADEEWKLFRESLIDGSFRYCQKSQCPNIVGGWLPKKDKCKNANIKNYIEKRTKFIPEMEEIHLSYDSHCNLRCPSCRTDFCTNSTEQNKEYDRFYFRYLQKYVKKAKHLCLQGCGEALLSPHSRKIIESLSDSCFDNLKVELRTNVTSLTDRNWESLGEGRRRVRHIAASIDAATKESFEKIRYPAKWELVCTNLRYIKELRDRKEIDLFEFHVVIQRDNLDELIDIVRLAAAMNADVVTFSRMVNWMGKAEEEYLYVNPFWYESDIHSKFKKVIQKLMEIRENIDQGRCEFMEKERRMLINIPFVPDLSEHYDSIRYGELKIR